MESQVTISLIVAILTIAGFAISEILPFVKSVKANGILQLIGNIIGKIS